MLSWISTFVVHFLAKRTLEKHSAQFPNEEVSFSIINVNRSRSFVSPSWADMESIITAAVPQGVNPVAVINCLKEKIETNPTGGDKGKVVETFRSMIANEPDKKTVIPARLHAALVLATLGSEEFRAAAIVHGDENLRRLCEVRQPISVGIHLTDHLLLAGSQLSFTAYFLVKPLLRCLLDILQDLEGRLGETTCLRPPSHTCGMSFYPPFSRIASVDSHTSH